MTVVIGTAGHIDHGKTTLLRVLTGTDADRLPEEQRRGLTIDVGYAHFAPDDGPEVDFVDVPGHDKLVGNMLVGAGEIDAALVVVAANDGPRAQTWEHLGLLDALGIDAGIVAITKSDLVDVSRVADVATVLREAISRTSLAGAAMVAVSAASGEGLEELRARLAALRDELASDSVTAEASDVHLAIDRVFSIRGRGQVVTGSSRGRPIRPDEVLRVLPDDVPMRVRGLQVHDDVVEHGPAGGRVALNLAGERSSDLRRGQLLVSARADRDPLAPVAADRLLVLLRRPVPIPGRADAAAWPPLDGVAARLHIGTDQADAAVGRSGRDDVQLADGDVVAMLRLDRQVAAAVGQRFVLRQPAPAGLLAGGTVLDAAPVHGRSRRRQDLQRLSALAGAIHAGRDGEVLEALLAIHGHQQLHGRTRLAGDISSTAAAAAVDAVETHQRDHPDQPAMPLSVIRSVAAEAIRAQASVSAADGKRAATDVVEDLLADGRLRRSDDGARTPEFAAPARDPELDASMLRLEQALDVSAPPPLSQAAIAAGCPPAGIRELEQTGRLIVVGDDLAWAAAAYERLRELAVKMARSAPLTPAALRDATGTSRKYIMALLEDLARRGVLTRTPAGHVPGPRA